MRYSSLGFFTDFTQDISRKSFNNFRRDSFRDYFRTSSICCCRVFDSVIPSEFCRGFLLEFFPNSVGKSSRDSFNNYIRDWLGEIFRNFIGVSVIYCFRDFFWNFLRDSFTDYSRNCLRNSSRILTEFSPGLSFGIHTEIPSLNATGIPLRLFPRFLPGSFTYLHDSSWGFSRNCFIGASLDFVIIFRVSFKDFSQVSNRIFFKDFSRDPIRDLFRDTFMDFSYDCFGDLSWDFFKNFVAVSIEGSSKYSIRDTFRIFFFRDSDSF